MRFKGRSFQTNSNGFRGREFQQKKAADVYRIAGIGDSVMMGWGVGQDETYLARLETLLNRRLGPGRVEVLNFAVSGYNTIQEYYVLKDVALAYQPDLIILGYVGNDFEGPNFRRAPWRFYSRFAVLNWLFSRTQLLFRFIGRAQLYDWRPFSGRIGRPPADFEEAFLSIAAMASRNDIPLICVLDSRYQSERLSHRELSAMAGKLGAESVDLYHLYRSLPESVPRHQAVKIADRHNRLYLIPGDTHANSLWHERTARVLSETIVKRLLKQEFNARSRP